MELKDLTRPLFVIKMEEFPYEFTPENIDKFDYNELHTILFIREVNKDGEWCDSVSDGRPTPATDLKKVLKNQYEYGVIPRKKRGYTDVKVFYSIYKNIFNLDLTDDVDGSVFTKIWRVAFEILCGRERRFHHAAFDFDVLYYDPYEGYHPFSVINDEYEMYDGNKYELIEMVEREMCSE